jgi:WD40 repeat protein
MLVPTPASVGYRMIQLAFVSVSMKVLTYSFLSFVSLAMPAYAQKPELVAQTGHAEAILSIRFSPNGKLVATASRDGTIKLWDARTTTELHTLPEGQSDSSLGFSSNGNILVNGGFHQDIKFWDVASSRLILTIPEVGFIRSLDFSPDGNTFATVDTDKTIQLWGIPSGEVLYTLTRNADNVDGFYRIVFRSDGKRLAIVSDDGTIRIWDLYLRRLVGMFTAPRSHIDAISFSPDGKTLVGIGDEKDSGLPNIWNLETDKSIHPLTGLSGIEGRQVAFSSDGKTVAFRRWDNSAGDPLGATFEIWDVGTGQKLQAIPIQNAYGTDILALTFSPDKKTLASGDDRGTLRLFDLATGKESDAAGHIETVASLTFSSDGRVLGTISGLPVGHGAFGREGGNGNTVRLWDLSIGKEILTLPKHSGQINCLAFTSDSKFLATGSDDKAVRVWEVSSGAEQRKFSSRFPIESVAFSPDGKLLAGGTSHLSADSDAVTVWETDTGTEIHRLRFSYGVTDIAFSPDGKTLAIGMAGVVPGEKAVRVWNSVTWEEIPIATEQDYPVSAIAFSPDGNTLASNRATGRIELLDLTGNKEVRTIGNGSPPPPPFARNSVAFNSGSLATVDMFGTIHIWDKATGEELQHFETTDHSIAQSVYSMSFRFDGKTLATGSGGPRIHLWDVHNGRELCSLFSLADGTWAVVDPEGRFDTNDVDEIKGLHWVFPDDPFRALPPETFMRDYYEPRLLSRLLAGEDLKSVRLLASLNRVQPIVEVEKAEWQDSGSRVAIVTVRVERNSEEFPRDEQMATVSTEAYDLRLFRDAQLVGWAPKSSIEWQLLPSPVGPKADELDLKSWREKTHIRLEADGSERLSFVVQVPRHVDLKRVTFTAYAFNEDRVKSATASMTLEVAQELKPRTGRAYIISAGVNRTESSPNWDLQYAASDARAMAEVVTEKLTATKQFAEVVPIRLVSDEPGKRLTNETTATKVHLQAVLDVLAGRRTVDEQLKREIPEIQKVERAQPEDLVLLAVSSHGYTDDRGVFHIVLADIGMKTPQDKITPELQGKSLSSDELSAWLRDVDAGEMVMVVDSCHSAATVEAEGFKPGPMGSRGLGQLAYDKGMRILAASKSEQSAVERDGIKHGLLSYALVDEGLKQGLADFQPKDGKILISEWLAYGEQEVPKLFREGDSKGLIQHKGGPDTAKDAYHGRKQTLPRYQQPVLFDFSKNQIQLVLDQKQ